MGTNEREPSMRRLLGRRGHVLGLTLLRLAVSLAAAAAVYWGADYWTTRIWNCEESLIVRVLGMGLETPVPSARGEQDSFPTLQRQLTLLILTGDQRGVTANVKVVRLDGSGLDPIEGRRYLLVQDVFEGGEVQYSIADAYRVPLIEIGSASCRERV